MSRRSRLLVAIAALLMLVAYVAPLWRIQLIAPQYPEGLGLRIWVNQVSGAKPSDLHSINGLNHYIGMKVIDPDTIPELRYMPWLLAGLVASGVGVALLGKRKVLVGWLVMVGLGAIAGLADFWKWGYDYGHQLDPRAIIKVPGMSYQPPLLGTKQLLNFHATSWPGVGGWAIVAAIALALVALFLDRPRRSSQVAHVRGAEQGTAALHASLA